MAIRLTGMHSGLDTESMIAELVKAKSKKVDTLKKSQMKLQVKQDALKAINQKVVRFHDKVLGNLTMSSAYKKKITVVSDPDVASVTAKEGAMSNTQSLKVDKLATTAYMTGDTISGGKGTTKLEDRISASDFDLSGNTQISVTVGGTAHNLTFSKTDTINDVVNALKGVGLEANFDAANERLYISSTESGLAGDFAFTGDAPTLAALGLSTGEKVNGEDAEIWLNNVHYTSSTNNFEINGLQIAVKQATTSPNGVTLTTQDDVSGIYDTLKDFIKEYNELINELDKLYNAPIARTYEPLLPEDREGLTDAEIEKWEQTIKDSVLRRDSSVNTVANIMKNIMSEGFEVGGKKMYLYDFGIEKAEYLSAEKDQKNAYSILGDSDYSGTAYKDNLLREAIEKDPDSVVDFFTQLTKAMKSKLFDAMSVTEFSSSFTIYEDKKMKSDYDDYTKKIAEAEKKLTAYEDKWYSKFAAMETALARLQKNASAIEGLLGGF